MSYPRGTAAANRLVAVALEWEAAETAYYAVIPAINGIIDDPAVGQYWEACSSLRKAVKAYRAAIAVEHVQGPDMDARS